MCFCQYCSDLYYCSFVVNLKSASVIPLASFVLLRIALADGGLLWFHTNLMIFCSI